MTCSYSCAHLRLQIFLRQIKDVEFNWIPECQTAFNKLKIALTSVPVLVKVDFDKPFELHTDASGIAVGAALHQFHNDGQWKPIGYFSRKLKPVETRYSTTDKEALAIVLACRFFHHFLWGNKFHIKMHPNYRVYGSKGFYCPGSSGSLGSV